jgi:hypothetical protein
MNDAQLDVDADDDVAAARLALVRQSQAGTVTLDGERAELVGSALTQAYVLELDGDGRATGKWLAVEWDRVAYILEHGGAFAS